MNKPIVAITMGDPAGIGPEICVKALSNPEISQIARCVVIGDSLSLKYAIKILRIPGVSVYPIKKIEDARYISKQIDVLDLHNVDFENLDIGFVSAQAGRAAYEYIEKAIMLACAKKVDAIATAPISKEAIHKAGYRYDGHTEILAKKTKTQKYAMMFVSDKFWVILATTHIPLKNVPKNINKKKILEIIKMAQEALMKAGKPNGKIGVAGLNPHAGEAGIFGKEEKKHITPAIAEAKKLGIKVYGPISPDAVFGLANAGAFDLVVAMYHDQGLIPLKLIAFNKSVNVTLGLPFVRTSVDHGTGFGIAGKGIANPQSLIEAIKVAAAFSRQK